MSWWHQVGLSQIVIPSGYVNIAIERGPVEIVRFAIKNGDLQEPCETTSGYVKVADMS